MAPTLTNCFKKFTARIILAHTTLQGDACGDNTADGRPGKSRVVRQYPSTSFPRHRAPKALEFPKPRTERVGHTLEGAK